MLYEQEQTALRQSITEAESALVNFEQDTANVFPVIYIMIDFVFYRYFEKWNDQTKAVQIYSFISSKRFAPCPRFTETFDKDSLIELFSRYSLYFRVAYAFLQVWKAPF